MITHFMIKAAVKPDLSNTPGRQWENIRDIQRRSLDLDETAKDVKETMDTLFILLIGDDNGCDEA